MQCPECGDAMHVKECKSKAFPRAKPFFRWACRCGAFDRAWYASMKQALKQERVAKC